MTIRLSTGLQNALAGINTELVTNGTFDTDATGWTASTATLTGGVDSIGSRDNVLKVDTAGGYGYQAITTKTGHFYKLTFMHFSSGSGNGYLYVGTAAGGSQLYTSGNLTDTSWTTKTIGFVATGTTTYISVGCSDANAQYYDSISLNCESHSLQDCLNGASIKIYSGTQPSDPDDVATGTLLVTINNGGSGITWADATDGVIAKTSTETWSGVTATTGTAGYFRITGFGDLGTDNTTDWRIDGSCGTSGADLDFSSLAFTVGATQTISNYELEVPMSA